MPLVEVDPGVADILLTALRRARIAAYLEVPSTGASDRPQLWVAESERGDARTIVAAAARHAQSAGGAAVGETETHPSESDATATPGPFGPVTTNTANAPNPLEAASTDDTFREMVANWHVDTVAAVRSAERDLTQEDADWRARLQPNEPVDEEEHYVPPPPPPLPKLALQTVWALIILIASVAMLAFGDLLGLGGNFAFFCRRRRHPRRNRDVVDALARKPSRGRQRRRSGDLGGT